MIGLLGLGFLGQHIWLRPGLPPGSWGAGHRSEAGIPVLPFDWGQPPSWAALPEQGALVLSIPPLSQDPEAETQRLEHWGRWMNQHRPGLKRLVYISSTGVYPNQPGDYSEDTPAEPDGLRGQMRLASELALAPFFDLKVIRPAAIYGPGRGIPARIKAGQPIPSDSGPIYRIHVDDLAQIALLAAIETNFPPLVLAADQGPASSLAVAEWLLAQPTWAGRGLSLNLEEGYLARKGYGSHPERRLTPKRLQEMGYRYLFPTYQEGLQDEL
ncbi:MAG: hypothetical protein RRB13_09470 [bacterium]|nr:hypothetical protein [bacterium]